MVSACGKMPINGDLDGRWQIMKIAYASGEEETPKRAYYSVALHTINLMKVDVTSQTGNMEYTGDSLFVVMPVSKVEDLLPFGMNGTEQRFGVKELTSKYLSITIGLCPIGVQEVLIQKLSELNYPIIDRLYPAPS